MQTKMKEHKKHLLWMLKCNGELYYDAYLSNILSFVGERIIKSIYFGHGFRIYVPT